MCEKLQKRARRCIHLELGIKIFVLQNVLQGHKSQISPLSIGGEYHFDRVYVLVSSQQQLVLDVDIFCISRPFSRGGGSSVQRCLASVNLRLINVFSIAGKHGLSTY